MDVQFKAGDWVRWKDRRRYGKIADAIGDEAFVHWENSTVHRWVKIEKLTKLSWEDYVCNAFQEGADIQTLATRHGKTPEEVEEAIRKIAKLKGGYR